ncbi:MAG: ATP-binding protein [Myxococcales bacterium]
MGALLRSRDWRGTAVGAANGWSPALRAAVDLVTANGRPMLLWWGAGLTQFYNDACRDLLGELHPGALGEPAATSWGNDWSRLGPLVEAVLRGGPPTSVADVELRTRSRGSACLSPVPDDTAEDGVGGVLAVFDDASAESGVEEELRRSRGALSAVLAAAPAGILLAQPDGLVTWSSSVAERLLGGPAKGDRSGPTGAYHFERLDGTAVPVEELPLRRALAVQAAAVQELVIVRADGSRVTVSANASPLVAEDGSVQGAICVFQEVTERKQAEAALRQALAEAEEGRRVLEAMMDSIPEGIAIAGGPPDFPIVRISRQGWAMEGGVRPGMTGVSAGHHQVAWNIVHPDGSRPRPEEMPLYRASRHGEDVRNVEFALLQPDGGMLPVLVDAVPIRDAGGQIVGAVNCWRDIRELKRAQDAIRESEARQVLLLMFSDALRLLRDAREIQSLACQVLAQHLEVEHVYFAELDWRRQHSRVSAEYPPAPVSGASEGQPFGEHAEAFELLRRGRPLFVDDATAGAAQVSPAARAYGQSRGLGAWGAVPLVKGGEVSWCLNVESHRPRTFTDEDVALVADVAERTWVAVERARSEEELRESRARLEEADRRKDHFLAVLSHELRNPLTPVKNGLYVLAHAPPGSDQARRAQLLIGRQVDQLTHLVDELLDVTRINRGKVQLQRSLLELTLLVRQTVEDHHSLFDASGLKLSLSAPARPVVVDADPHRVAQIVGNLLLNAAKFTPRGGRVAVEVAADEPLGRCEVRIRDSGVGLEPAMLDRLFEPFIQADASLDRSKGGLGLGLALVKGLVELHGGTVAARSAGLGQGAEFTVRLPLASGAGGAVQAAAPAPALPRRRILIIEDNVDAADSLREVLELDGHEVAVANDGPAGLALARRTGPDVVLCDIGLPGMDGYAVARAFRLDEALRHVLLVALSGYAQREDMERAAAAGFDHHLAKPPNLEKLEAVLAGAPRSPGASAAPGSGAQPSSRSSAPVSPTGWPESTVE